METILIVEDEQNLLKLLEITFKSNGYKVIKAINGAEAYLLALKELPNLILMDILLPGESGLEVLKRLKEEEKTKDIPVVMLTNFSEPQTIDQAKRLGARDYLIKSSNDPSTVLEKVQKYL
ncbi:MAG: response regulator [Patescibacteria group bacterium]